MTKQRRVNRGLLALLLACVAALPLPAQYEEWLNKARQAYRSGEYEQCVNNCKIYSSMNGSTSKDELQLKAERMLACKAAGTLTAYRYMAQYNPDDTWAKAQLKKTLASSDDHKHYVFFLPGNGEFDGTQQAIINDLAAEIKRNSNVYEVVGYDSKDAYASLKSERSRRVRDALVAKGISQQRLKLVSNNNSLAADANTCFLTEAVVIVKTTDIAGTSSSAAGTSTSSAQTGAPTNQVAEKSNDITGMVTDAEGQPLIGASVSIMGRAVAATDHHGVFKLRNIDKSQVMRIDYIGYEPLSIKVGDFRGFAVLHELWLAGKNTPLAMGISIRSQCFNGKPDKILVGCVIRNAKRKNIKVVAYFYDSNGNPILAQDKTIYHQFKTSGTVSYYATSRVVYPESNKAEYNALELTIPTLTKVGQNAGEKCYYRVCMWDDIGEFYVSEMKALE